MGQRIFLCFFQIFQQCARCNHTTVIVFKAESLQRFHLKMLHQCLSTECIVKIPGVQRIDGDSKPVFQIIQIHSAHIERLITNDLRGHKFRKFVHHFSGRFDFCDHVFTCRYISNRQPETICDVYDTHDIVVFRLIQCLHVKIGTWGDDTNNVPFNYSLRKLRIFHLLADCHLVSF